jgi:hypothetical protein
VVLWLLLFGERLHHELHYFVVAALFVVGGFGVGHLMVFGDGGGYGFMAFSC